MYIRAYPRAKRVTNNGVVCMTDKTDLIVELIKSLKDDQKDHRDEMRDHQRQSLSQHEATNMRLTAIEIDLREHKEGVIQNRTKNTSQDEDIYDLSLKYGAASDRIDKIEAPNKAKTYIRNKILQAGGIAAAVLGIIKLLDYLGK